MNLRAESLAGHALDRLVDRVATLTGFSRQAIATDAIVRLARSRAEDGGSLEALLSRAEAGDPSVLSALIHCVLVNETFFFRQPEHFHFLTDTFLPDRLRRRRGDQPLRAWSAGCATGEEAYSLAGSLQAAGAVAGRAVAVGVLGTDLVASNLARARAAVYGPWSIRPSTPLVCPVLEPAAPHGFRVVEAVRGLVHFAQHNLLQPPPGADFDVVFCRNVLVYFSQPALRQVLAHLAASLAPGGLLVLGTMDVTEPIPGLEQVGPSELNLFVRAEAPPARPRPTKVRSAPPVVQLRLAAREPASPSPIAIHLEAMVQIERGHLQAAQRMLLGLLRAVPDYLPGLLECALLLARHGELHRAHTLASELLRRAEACASDSVVEGPEALPASYYRISANALLERVRPT